MDRRKFLASAAGGAIVTLPFLVKGKQAQGQSQPYEPRHNVIQYNDGVNLENLFLDGVEDVSIQGNGRNTILQPADPSKPIFELWRCKNVTIKDMHLEGIVGVSDYLTWMFDIDGLTVENVSFSNCDIKALHVSSWSKGRPLDDSHYNYNIRVENCEFRNCSRNAVSVGKTKGVWIKNNTIHDSNDVAIEAGEWVENVRVADNIIHESATAILVNDIDGDVSITGNQIDENRRNGIKVTYLDGDSRFGPSPRYVIANNTIKAYDNALISGYWAIVARCDGGIVHDNFTDGYYQKQISLEGNPHVYLHDNYKRDCYGAWGLIE